MKLLIVPCILSLLMVCSSCESDAPLPEGVEGAMIGRWYADSSRCQNPDRSWAYLMTAMPGSYSEFKANHTVVVYSPYVPSAAQYQTNSWQLLPNDSNFVISGTDIRSGQPFSDTLVIRQLSANRFVYQQVNLSTSPLALCYYVEYSFSK